MKTMGTEMRMPVDDRPPATPSWTWTCVDVGEEGAEQDTAAMTAEPMATPLVMALVVLPTASRSAMIWRALASSRQPGHLADAVGVVGDGAEGVHGHVVARQGEHPDTGHGHAVEDVRRPAGPSR